MCSECTQYPCSSRCPNAPEEKPVLSCDICWKNNIYAGDNYWDIDGTIVCEECMENAKKVAEGD